MLIWQYKIFMISMKYFTVISIALLLLCFKSNAVQFRDLSSEEKLKQADFVGLVKINGGIQSAREEYQYQIEIIEAIKGKKHIEKLTTSCGLSLATKYLIYASIQPKTDELAVPYCIQDTFESVLLPPHFEPEIAIPIHLKDSFPLKNIEYRNFCSYALNGKCIDGLESIVVQYKSLKKELLQLVTKLDVKQEK